MKYMKVNKQETKETKKAVKGKAVSRKFLTARFFDIVRGLHVTEKASFAAEQNKYIFKVAKESNKIEIKKAVEGIYNVNVDKVTIINAKSKVRRQGMTIGTKKGFKKAIVNIKKGETIDFSKK